MASKTKEQQQKEIEAKRKLREKQMLQLRASNEMLEEAKKDTINRYGEDSDSTIQLLNDINVAQEQNTERAKTYLNVDLEAADYLQYNKVNPQEEKAYYDRLKNLGKSDELLHMKNVEEQVRLYEEQKNKSTAQPKKKSKSKLDELTAKLKQIQNMANDNNESTNKVDEDIPNPIVGEIKRENEVVDNFFKDDTEEKKKTAEVIHPAVEHVKEANSNVKPIQKDEVYPEFDPRDVPSYIQYDMIPLPSNGECYAHKKGKIPVAYLTAADENLISSRNLYQSGSMIDLILERKILDRSIRVSDLCKGDRDAIAIWLRATAYGPEYPVIAPYKGEEIETTIDLGNIEYLDFDIKGDEHGWFDYETETGDKIKFKILSYKEETELIEANNTMNEKINRRDIANNIDKCITASKDIESPETDSIVESLNLIKDWANKHSAETNITDDTLAITYITDRMYKQTMSINGNTDREFIKNYIDNMRSKYAYAYRQYISKHIPGVNLEITVPVPESMGGGSFNTFLSIGETIFINV